MIKARIMYHMNIREQEGANRGYSKKTNGLKYLFDRLGIITDAISRLSCTSTFVSCL